MYGEKKRQSGFCAFKASLGYIESSKTLEDTYTDPVLHKIKHFKNYHGHTCL